MNPITLTPGFVVQVNPKCDQIYSRGQFVYVTGVSQYGIKGFAQGLRAEQSILFFEWEEIEYVGVAPFGPVSGKK